MNKSLLFVTGTRADFGKLEPLSFAAHKAGFQITYFITGMHMLSLYGETRREVRNLKYADFFEYVNQRRGDSLETILAKTVVGFSDYLEEHRPDLVIIHGDRVEAMAASVVCAMKYIPSAHIEGGELSGTIDESIRHCNTKLCHSHFVSSESAKARVIAMGESASRVFVIGSPELDSHAKYSGVSIDQVKEHYEIPFDDYGIVTFHPVTSELDSIEKQAKILYEALEKSNRCYVVISPNNDPGSEKLFDIISKLPAERFRVLPSMRFNFFSELMRNASLMIGNSSAGVREMPFLGRPSINVGSRQNNRALSPSVVTLPADNVDLLRDCIDDMWGQTFVQDASYGNGSAAEQFVSVLQEDCFWQLPMQKSFCEHSP